MEALLRGAGWREDDVPLPGGEEAVGSHEAPPPPNMRSSPDMTSAMNSMSTNHLATLTSAYFSPCSADVICEPSLKTP